MRVTMLLADAAQVVDNKLYVLGGGWSVTGPGPTPFAIALKIEVPWDQANRRHQIEIRLLDADGRLVSLPGLEGQGLIIAGEFEVGRPAGLPAGTPIDFAVALNPSGPVAFPQGGRFVFSLKIDDEHDEDWELGFTTRAASG
jgi:hypothetical protein